MAIDLLDLATGERYGPFNTPAAAHASAGKSGFTHYELWEDGKRIETGRQPRRGCEECG